MSIGTNQPKFTASCNAKFRGGRNKRMEIQDCPSFLGELRELGELQCIWILSNFWHSQSFKPNETKELTFYQCSLRLVVVPPVCWATCCCWWHCTLPVAMISHFICHLCQNQPTHRPNQKFLSLISLLPSLPKAADLHNDNLDPTLKLRQWDA